MEHEDIDWNSIESIFEEDDTYEDINAPKWVDLSSPCETVVDEAWFCKPGCKHPKCAEDYLKPKQYTKVKLLKSITISEILPFRDRTRREAKAKNGEKGSEDALSGGKENRNPNLNLCRETIPMEKSDRKQCQRGLKSTFSARNLVGGREILSHITEFCSELKKMTRKKSSKKGAMSENAASDGVLGELKERIGAKQKD